LHAKRFGARRVHSEEAGARRCFASGYDPGIVAGIHVFLAGLPQKRRGARLFIPTFFTCQPVCRGGNPDTSAGDGLVLKIAIIPQRCISAGFLPVACGAGRKTKSQFNI
jgi:hypothetical protein